MTTQDIYTGFLNQLQTVYEAREAANIADWVFESCGIKRLDRITLKDVEVTPSTAEQLQFKLEQLLQHIPVQYVLNEAWFYRMKLFVNNNVLIPRPETEELVEWIISEQKETTAGDQPNANNVSSVNPPPAEPLHILDIGTGSGCISIAINKTIPTTRITAIDASPQAIEVARQNAIAQKTQVTFLQLDFLDEKTWPSLASFDIIVSNPPYIPAQEKASMSKNVRDHEPGLALFVEDSDPFIFYRKMALFAAAHLKPGGKIFAEVHEAFGEAVHTLFEEHGFTTVMKKDIYEKDRMIKASK